nr:5'-nucleotidase [uncultured Desulfobacter sp.]
MPYDLSKRLVIGLASSALFDLKDSDKVFTEKGEDVYREYQLEKLNEPLPPGVAFPFIKRLLSLNQLRPSDPPVEVMLLSKNDPDTGLRVMKSIQHHGLGMTRAIFLQGRHPHKYIRALNISLFLSANEVDVQEAISSGFPAGQVLSSNIEDESSDSELRIAFDFDGVVADDEAEAIYQKTHDLNKFHEHEQENVNVTHNPGPLKDFLKKVSDIQKMEKEKSQTDGFYSPKLRISIVTARNAPSHERVINSMRSWGIIVNEAFFLGGIDKSNVLEILKPHIFFDDQKLHLESASKVLPSVHIPFGVANQKII